MTERQAPTQAERDRAARLGRLAAKTGRPAACPYRPGKGGGQRVLALVFVRAYHQAGGTIDGVDYGDGAAGSSSTARTRAPRPAAGGGRHRADGSGPYGHLGYGR